MSSERTEAEHQYVEHIHAGVFEMDTDYSTHRSHGTDDWLLIYTATGAGRVTGTGEPAVVREGQAVLYAPHQPQDYATAQEEGRWKLLWSHFRPPPHWLGLLQWPALTPGVGGIRIEDTRLRNKTEAALIECIEATRSIEPDAIAFAFNAFERALLLLQRACGTVLDARIRKGIDYMTQHVERPFSLSDLAKACGLSPSRTAHLFRAQTGLPPAQYMERLRMQRAVSLLKATQWSIKEIAAACGYADPFYFSARFKKNHGRSPKAYRMVNG